MQSSAKILALAGELRQEQREQLTKDHDILLNAVKAGQPTLNAKLNSYSQRATEIEQRLAAHPR